VDSASEIMRIDEVAAYLKVHPTTVYRLLKRKQLPAFRVGTDFRFRRADVDEWIREKERARLEKP
jgi:excisionase family DNA binding protein